MKIILLQDIKSLGKKGDAKDVSEGYARNFLLPKGLAEVATVASIAKIEAVRQKEKERWDAEIRSLREQAGKISGTKVAIQAKEKKGKLFGSITPKQIVSELEKEGLKISPSCVILKEAIKKTGQYEVEIKLADSVSAKLKLEVRGVE
jgi:large subunit ribosomal protein L9